MNTEPYGHIVLLEQCFFWGRLSGNGSSAFASPPVDASGSWKLPRDLNNLSTVPNFCINLSNRVYQAILPARVADAFTAPPGLPTVPSCLKIDGYGTGQWVGCDNDV